MHIIYLHAKHCERVVIILKKITLLFSFFILLFSLLSCAKISVEDLLFYQNCPLEINADFTIGAERYSGNITLSEPKTESQNKDMSIEFTSPQTISGITAGISDGKEYLKLDNINIQGKTDEYSNMLEVCRLFSLKDAEINTADFVDFEGVRYRLIDLTDSFGHYLIYCDIDDNLPRRIEAQTANTNIILTIKSIKITQPRQ